MHVVYGRYLIELRVIQRRQTSQLKERRRVSLEIVLPEMFPKFHPTGVVFPLKPVSLSRRRFSSTSRGTPLPRDFLVFFKTVLEYGYTRRLKKKLNNNNRNTTHYVGKTAANGTSVLDVCVCATAPE